MGLEAEGVTVTATDSGPSTIFAIGATAVAITALAFGLARLARWLPPSIPTAVSVVFCAAFAPALLLVAGYTFIEDESNFFDWIAALPPRTYRNMGFLLGLSFAGAWLGSRGRTPPVDPSVFD